MVVNLIAKYMKSYPCNVCNHMIGEVKSKQCAACGEAVHVKCIPGKPGIGYWFCDDCTPKYTHGHDDPALHIPLHNFIRGTHPYPGADKETCERLQAAYRFVRGCLIWTSDTGELIIPPPCLREDIIQKTHDDLLHQGWERTLHILK